MTPLVQRLEGEIRTLRDEVQQLRVAGSGLRIPIQSLDPEPYDVLAPMEAVVRPSSDGFVATFFDANVNASGETEGEAFDNLKDMIVASYEELSRIGSERLGPELGRQLAVLQRFVRSRG